ncbi:MAG: hypothetical protein WA919_18500 [Coleofasciculaceae cyanobacterium]
MYQKGLVDLDTKDNSVERVWCLARNLSIEEKAELVELLLGRESGMVVVSKSSHLTDYIVAQMNLLSLDGLEYVLRKIGARFVSDWN